MIEFGVLQIWGLVLKTAVTINFSCLKEQIYKKRKQR